MLDVCDFGLWALALIYADFVIVDTAEEADILWLLQHFHDFEVLMVFQCVCMYV